MKRTEQMNKHSQWRAPLYAVVLFYGMMLVLDAPWLYEGASLLPLGEKRDFFIRISQPFKAISERVYADRVRRSIESSFGAWLNGEAKQR